MEKFTGIPGIQFLKTRWYPGVSNLRFGLQRFIGPCRKVAPAHQQGKLLPFRWILDLNALCRAWCFRSARLQFCYFLLCSPCWDLRVSNECERHRSGTIGAEGRWLRHLVQPQQGKRTFDLSVLNVFFSSLSWWKKMAEVIGDVLVENGHSLITIVLFAGEVLFRDVCCSNSCEFSKKTRGCKPHVSPTGGCSAAHDVRHQGRRRAEDLEPFEGTACEALSQRNHSWCFGWGIHFLLFPKARSEIKKVEHFDNSRSYDKLF